MDFSPLRLTSYVPSTSGDRQEGLTWLISRMKREGSKPNGCRLHEYLAVFSDPAFGRVDLNATGTEPVDELHIAFNEGGDLLDSARGLLQPTPVRRWFEKFEEAAVGPFAARGALPLEPLPGSATTMQEQPQMLEDLRAMGSSKLLMQLVAQRLGGDDGLIVEADDTAASTTTMDRARATQFELYLGMFARGRGCEVEFEEPDVVLRKGRYRVGIAAKRLTSLKQLETRVRQACDQIMRSGRMGMVAIDWTAALDLHRKVFVMNSRAEHDELHSALGAVIHEHGQHLGALVRRQPGCENVVAFASFGRMMVFARRERAFITHRSYHGGPANGPSHPEALFFKKFMAGTL